MRRIALAIGVTCALSGSAAGQTRAAAIAAQQAEKARALVPERPPLSERVIRQVQRVFAPPAPAIVPVFGGVRTGSGPALGAALILPAGRGRLDARGAWSFENTRKAEVSLRVPPEAFGAELTLLASAEAAPRTGWFGLGRRSATRQDYGLTTRLIGAALVARLPARLTVAGSASYFDADASILSPSRWLEIAGGLSFDTRRAPEYTRTGAFLGLGIAHAASTSDAFDSFQRVTLDARGFVPLLHEQWVIALQGRAELTANADRTPFFLLPYLGGGQSLRGYDEYRFTDRQAVSGRAELRWTAGRAVDLAAFVDAGTVAPAWRQLRLADRATGWGVGVRFHGYRATGLRVDVARGAGWRLHLAQRASF